MTLGVDYFTLTAIRQRHSSDHGDCLQEMLAHCLQANYSLTWGHLCESLRHITVGRSDVADEIEGSVSGIEFSTGSRTTPTQNLINQKVLTIYDMQHVYEKLNSASPHWYDLGLALGLPHYVLTNIDSKCRGDFMSSMREMLFRLLSTQHVTWGLLSDALKKPTVRLIHLADSITGNYFQCLCI